MLPARTPDSVVSLKKGKDRLHNTKSPSFITQGGWIDQLDKLS